jgi:hypothetical protein
MSAYSVRIPMNIVDAVSDAAPFGQYVIGLYIPLLNDGSVVYIQASEDSVTNWARVLRADGSGDWSVTALFDKWVYIDQFAPFKFLRVEVVSPQGQAAVRTFIFLQKPNMEGSA